MNKVALVCPLVVTILYFPCFALCQNQQGSNGRFGQPVKERAGTCVEGNNSFALDLYSHIALDQGNIAFAPSPLHSLLAMVAEGAEGETRQQISRMLRIEPDSGKTYKIHTGNLKTGKEAELLTFNTLWGDKDITWKKDFTSMTDKCFAVKPQVIDFASKRKKAASLISSYVAKQSNNQIKHQVPSIEIKDKTSLYLTSAACFKGQWVQKFDKQSTKNLAFTPSFGSAKDVPMMYIRGRFRYSIKNGFQILSMPYMTNEISMVFLLPSDPNNLSDLEKSFTTRRLDSLTERLRLRVVDLYCPKFKISCDLLLKDKLSALGMKDAFVSNKADFSGMHAGKDLYISDIVHSTIIAVEEKGTSVECNNGVAFEVKGNENRLLVSRFCLDHPFIFYLLHEKTQTILLIGRVSDPTQ